MAVGVQQAPFQVYFAGAHFKTHELHTNAAIATKIEELSKGRFKIILPQDMVPRSMTPKDIRDGELKLVARADAVILQLDGTELDSGTVVEMMAAHSLAIPVVKVCTDFGGDGDQDKGGVKGDLWNLMASGYPRTV
jgi:nucleoside 2-deoxyribosyltransferase